MPVYRQTTAQGHHTRSKASKTRITSSTAAIARAVGGNATRLKTKSKSGALRKNTESNMKKSINLELILGWMQSRRCEENRVAVKMINDRIGLFSKKGRVYESD